MIIPTALAAPIAPLYLFTTDVAWIAVGFVLQGAFGGALYSQLPSYLSERFPTEVRATASAFCYHQGVIFGGLVPPVLVYFATSYNFGFAISMLVSTVIAAASESRDEQGPGARPGRRLKTDGSSRGAAPRLRPLWEGSKPHFTDITASSA